MSLMPFEPTSVMPVINGKTFRCECGANVFHHPKVRNTMPDGNGPWAMDDELYQCNGCGLQYRGRK